MGDAQKGAKKLVQVLVYIACDYHERPLSSKCVQIFVSHPTSCGQGFCTLDTLNLQLKYASPFRGCMAYIVASTQVNKTQHN